MKILIAGGFGVGKTTMVGSVSEITPLRTEEVLSGLGSQVDNLSGVEDKETPTVAFDFGRITVNSNMIVYLFGTPGQHRFWFMWDELAGGALGAVVLADTRRLDACFPAVDFSGHDRRDPRFVRMAEPVGELELVREGVFAPTRVATSTSRPTSCTASPTTRAARTSGRSPTPCSAPDRAGPVRLRRDGS